MSSIKHSCLFSIPCINVYRILVGTKLDVDLIKLNTNKDADVKKGFRYVHMYLYLYMQTLYDCMLLTCMNMRAALSEQRKKAV